MENLRQCNLCDKRLRKDNPRDFCKSCWAKLDCEFKDCGRKVYFRSTLLLCTGHWWQTKQGSELTNLVDKIDRSAEYCKIHPDFVHEAEHKGTYSCRACGRVQRWKYYYNLSEEDISLLLKKNDYRCHFPDCKKTFSLHGEPSFTIDHDHSCCPGPRSCGSCIRGILCAQHNTYLGRAEADYTLASKYIKQYEYRRFMNFFETEDNDFIGAILDT